MADETIHTTGTPTEASTLNPVEALENEANATDGDVHPEMLKVREREFKLAAKIPAFVMLKLSAAADPKTSLPAQMNAMLSFLTKIIHPDDNAAFMAYLEDADPVIEMDELNDIMTRATETIAARPTQQ